MEVAAGYECSGNSPRSVEGLSSCGLFKGVRLRDVLNKVGVNSKAREVVFFGTDRGAQEYKKFEESLLRLVHRLERSPRPEDREKAQGLRKAIDIINNQQVENRFNKLLTLLLANKQLTSTELIEAAGQNEELIKILRDMLEPSSGFVRDLTEGMRT